MITELQRRHFIGYGVCALAAYTIFSYALDRAVAQESSSEKADVFADIRKIARQLIQNEKGYWEASLAADHVFVFIPEGRFQMGSNDGLDNEQPAHSVLLSGYWIAKYPVTVSDFSRFVTDSGYVTDAEKGHGSWQWTGETPTRFSPFDPWEPRKDGRWNNIYFEQADNHPVGSISWNDANAYCAWLSKKLGVSIVLPTEAQWEKAARGEDGRRFPWGNDAPTGKHANLADKNFIQKYGRYTRKPHPDLDDGFTETSPVDAYPAGQSPYGVFDMAGNLGEWVYDIFDPDIYTKVTRINPTGPQRADGVEDSAIDRVNRGGSWVDWAGVDKKGRVRPRGGHSIRSAARTGDEQNSSDDHMGFRIAIDGQRVAEPPQN